MGVSCPGWKKILTPAYLYNLQYLNYHTSANSIDISDTYKTLMIIHSRLTDCY